MPPSPKFSALPGGRTILLSIKPKYADLILAGSKRVEFRRSWAAQEVTAVVLYSSSPIQKLVGVAKVESVISASPTALWQTCQERGGGLTRDELRSYFAGKGKGIAVFLGEVSTLPSQVDPHDIFDHFVPPQSFRYLDPSECRKFDSKFLQRSNRA